MKKSLAIVSAILALVCRASAADTAELERTRGEFEKLATQLPYLSLGAVLYDRPDRWFQLNDSVERAEHDRIIAQVTDLTHSKEPLLTLLRHNNPKVRTLAAVALFDREDPSVLPALASLCEDGAATFHDYNRQLANPIPKAPVVEQTVSNVISGMLTLYMGYGRSRGIKSDFAEYWASRSNRTYCAGWFGVQLIRARGGGNSGVAGNGREARVRTVRSRIEQLPADARAWILVCLGEHMDPVGWDSDLVSEAELVEAFQRLGPDKLLLMVQRRIPSDDPDLQPPIGYNYCYQRMIRFVLEHAGKLLRPEDSDALLSEEMRQRENAGKTQWDPPLTPAWAIAAATLNPRQATNILHAAFMRFREDYQAWDRARLSVALWRTVGEPALPLLADWFYTATPSRRSLRDQREMFIRAMEKEPAGRTVLAHMIWDTRLNSLHWGGLRDLGSLINWREKEAVISERELSITAQQFGDGGSDGLPLSMIQNNPRETARLQRTMDQWMKRLRESVPRLSNDK